MPATELILLRHAHAEPQAAAGTDAERPLSLRGEAEADAVAAWLAHHGLPERVICSPAQRTRQTLARVLSADGFVDTREDARIYEATPGDLMDVIADHRDCARLMLVGHNPGFESLAALLATGQSGDHRGMPPAGIAVLALPRGTELEPGCAQLISFWSP
ncbi:MAG: histidine phosphatase family protein [Chiayiivirga sp.]|jgi:phosphohistidine phosphatase|uniref:SixA phosphatase family protein n=1 Tax=Chiayiivirga sp. TaxID=2041042 RepID=UPI0025C20F4A|nr:histidine phosphatase family protein [Chiayiivirga sp.]MCI1711256.1 histidine phosphatase family protein [Chiayiivirga sp.]MCI1727940.1 histidine phosphatase family protein [Chiayiivirga sp.]